MCWSLPASTAFATFGLAATAVHLKAGRPRAHTLLFAYFTVMEVLQAAQYLVIDDCASLVNRVREGERERETEMMARAIEMGRRGACLFLWRVVSRRSDARAPVAPRPAMGKIIFVVCMGTGRMAGLRFRAQIERASKDEHRRRAPRFFFFPRRPLALTTHHPPPRHPLPHFPGPHRPGLPARLFPAPGRQHVPVCGPRRRGRGGHGPPPLRGGRRHDGRPPARPGLDAGRRAQPGVGGQGARLRL